MLQFAKVVLGSYALSMLPWDVHAAQSRRTGISSQAAVITQAPTLRNDLQRRSPATCAYVSGNAGMCSGRRSEHFTALKNANVVGPQGYH
jgi:hypothetical protein